MKLRHVCEHLPRKRDAEIGSKKCLKKSTSFRSIGNHYVEQKDYFSALQEYTKALFFSPFPEKSEKDQANEPFLLALIARCEIYYNLGMYEQCILDVTDALKFNLGTKTRHSLECLKKQCLKKLRLNSYSNDDVKNAETRSNFLRIGFDEAKGRILVCNEDIEAGKIIIEDFPFVSWLCPSLYDEYCNYCLLSLNNRKRSWSLYHKNECDYFNVFKYFSIGQMAARILMIAGIQNAISIENDSTLDLSDWEGRSFPNDYASISSLVGHQTEISYEYLCTFTCGALLLSKLLQQMLKENFDCHLVASIILKLMLIIKINAFAISDDKIENIKDLNERHFSGSESELHIGHGLYSICSLFSHSCDPNCYQLFKGAKMIVVTTKQIKAGEEAMISYGPNYKVADYRKRQKKLKDVFNFQCKCFICEKQL
ncbi:SET and MYND domain-containing protein 4-like protein [Dinothrombium tinctorium]|uniref:SET and MYND domain-containing protein 4-like protein n=1 Tax=Dinothrombium tinctorium TaxID=1965070 RepID=A0A443QU58_9ACAR|nr:SET and MYND domain-containing protein 4-like protein [Dinothrombium tinctorium]